MNDFMNFTSTATLTSQNSSIFGTAGSSALNTITNTQSLAQTAIARKKAIQTIADSIKELKELGYKEDNCKMVQIT
jgi:hypothetical protein